MTSHELKAFRLDETIGSVSTQKMADTRKHVDAEIKRADRAVVEIDKSPSGSPPEPAGEDARMEKLDIITDVQLVLVEKYRRAATVMWVAIPMLIIANVIGIVAILIVVDVGDKVVDVTTAVGKMVTKQEEANRRAEDIQKAVAETKQKVDEAVEASPKIEIDEDGKAKVVLPVRTKKKPDPPGPPQARRPKPKGSKSKSKSKSSRKAEFPIQLQ